MAKLRYSKELFTAQCEEVVAVAAEMLDGDGFGDTSGSLTQGERACLEQLVPQLNIAAELFRQCAKNKEGSDGKQE